MDTIKLTLSQALVRYLCAQKTEIDGEIVPLFAGMWGIFGHGNVAGLGEALHQYREQLPTYRSHCEQAMAHSAVAYAKQMRRRRMMAVTSSIGPGATNMVTAAAVAHVNRLPLLLLPGDVFMHRAPDPVLQQIESPTDGTLSANDCFRPVSRYFDRLVKPEQLITALPRAIATLTDAEICGPVTLCLPQDVQTEAYDFPLAFFEETLHQPLRMGADEGQLQRAAERIKAAKKPLLVAGGGVHYSGAVDTLRAFAKEHRVPVVETSAGKGALGSSDPFNAGGIGVIGASSANALAEECDLVIAVGTRLSDFTTGSRAVFSNGRIPQININVAHFDAYKHNAQALRADAKRSLQALSPLLNGWQSDAAWIDRLNAVNAQWAEERAAAGAATDAARPSDAQVTQVVNTAADPQKDVLVVAAGSMPAEGMKIWQSDYHRHYHSEYGYSCMGYEIAGGIGVKMADPEANVFVMLGDGSYLMLNSEIATSVMLGQKLIIVVLDNRGFGCINRLQNKCGGAAFNNLLDDGTQTVEAGAPAIDFAAHARSLGANAEKVDGLSGLEAALERAKASDITYVIAIDTNPVDSTGGGANWQVGVPEVSTRESVVASHHDWQAPLRKQQAY